MRFYKKSPLLLYVLGFIAFVVSANSDNVVFQGVQNDDGEAIKSAVKDDPSLLESIGPGGQTPLINAVLTGKLNAVKALLEINADVSATEKDGYNVLHAAGFQGRAEILQVLLEHFAANQKAGGAFAALDPATDKHRDGYYPIHRACWGRQPRHTETVKVFMKNGVPYDLPSEKGMTCEQMTRNEGTLAAIEEGKNGYEL